MVVDVKTIDADVIACCISLLLADVIANTFVVDVITTYNTEADVIACYISLLLADVIANIFVVDVMTTYYCIRRCFFLADVIAMYICGRCYNHWGWCYCLSYFILFI